MQEKNIKDQNIIIVAAGKSVRFKDKVKKIYYKLNGIPIIIHTLSNVSKVFSEDKIILVCAKEDFDKMKRMLKNYGFEKTIIVRGGDERAKSVLKGLKRASSEIVMIHDGARPFVSIGLCKKLMTMLTKENQCIVPAVNPFETVRVSKDNRYQIIDRNNVFLMQTPQAVFREYYFPILEKSVKRGECFTDDAEYVHKSGGEIKLSEGDRRNIKITSKDDIMFAEEILKRW